MRIRLALGAIASALAVVACSTSPPLLPAVPASSHRMMLGVYEPYSPGSYWQVSDFAHSIGEWPSIIDYYSKWGQSFAVGFARESASHGGEILVQIDPYGVSLASIAAGRDDTYLGSYASAVSQFGMQVIISFAQEMNGNWYPWGTGHTAPATYIAAWRHIVDLFRSEGTSNVTWLWDVNCAFPHSSSVSEWWPGAAYVTWVGLDCYYAHPSDSFESIFGPILTSVRTVTSKPALIAETAVGPNVNSAEQVKGLFAGVQASHLLGFVWFDQAQYGGDYHQNWRLEDDPPALGAYGDAVKERGRQ